MLLSDRFTDLALRSTVDTVINRLAASDSIRRIIRGLYDYPAYSEFLGEYLAPDIWIPRFPLIIVISQPGPTAST